MNVEKDTVDETLPPPIDWNTYEKASIITADELDKLIILDSLLKDPLILKDKVEELNIKEFSLIIQNVFYKLADPNPLQRLSFALKLLFQCIFFFLTQQPNF